MASEEHSELEKRAVSWLKEQRFTSIMIEPKVVMVGELAGDLLSTKAEVPKKGNHFRAICKPDVLGLSGSRKVIVECGSVHFTDRLSRFQELGYEVYIWPYDSLEPYPWTEDVCYCRCCGRKFERSVFIK